MSLSRWMLIGTLALSAGGALASDTRSQSRLGYDDPHTRRSVSEMDPDIGYDDPHTPRHSRPDQNAMNATLGYDDPHTRRGVVDESAPSLAGQVERAPWTASR